MSKKKAEKETRKIFWDYGLAIGTSILFALSVRFFLLEAYRMPSRAMQPAVEAGDTIFVSKFAYGFRVPGKSARWKASAPEYGDVIVFEFPDEPSRRYIKRVVGLPGDRVSLKNGALILNGKSVGAAETPNELCVTETLPNAKAYEACLEPTPFTSEKEVMVPAGEAFVIGDLRSNSAESRRLKVAGLVPFALIQGKAKFVWLSIQPASVAGSTGDWFSRIRFNRIFKPIH